MVWIVLMLTMKHLLLAMEKLAWIRLLLAREKLLMATKDLRTRRELELFTRILLLVRKNRMLTIAQVPRLKLWRSSGRLLPFKGVFNLLGG